MILSENCTICIFFRSKQTQGKFDFKSQANFHYTVGTTSHLSRPEIGNNFPAHFQSKISQRDVSWQLLGYELLQIVGFQVGTLKITETLSFEY